jgi:putative ABC transport system ATP-binding protein
MAAVSSRAELVVEGLAVEYRNGHGETVAPFQDLSMHARDGEVVVIRGPSGCGKTSLLSVLAGLLTPVRGTVWFGGQEVTGLGREALLRHRRHTVGVVFQSFNLVPSLSALENVMAPMVLAGVRVAEARERGLSLLGGFGLAAHTRRGAGGLSGGEQQRVAFARALAHDPPMLLADEPTAHLDASHVQTVLDVLRSLAVPGRLVVVATHDERVSALADVLVDLVTDPVGQPHTAPEPGRGPR